MSRYKILIVDDNKNNLFTLHTLLGKLDKCEVIEASSGYEALSKVLSEGADLIFLDIQMPEMDGFEVAKLLKSKEATKDIPIIFLTAVFKAEEFVKRGYEVGGVDYLTKPIDDNLLLNKARLYLKLFDREYALKKALLELKEKEGLLIQQSRLAAMGEMISAIAHQWRQPLNVIGLIVQEAEQSHEFGEMDDDGFANMVESIMKQLDYMSHTIDDFRDFFKPNKSKEYFNPRELVLEVFKIVSAQLKHHYIDIELNCECDSENKDRCEANLYGYPAEFRQVLLNIINNAKDSIIEKQKEDDEGFKGKILVNIVPKDNQAIIEISDNGVGLTKEVKEHLFEPYFSTKEATGTGIGLYMSKVIVEEHMRGKISAKPLEDGAKFIIETNQVYN